LGAAFKISESETDFEAATPLVELLGLERKDLVGCHGRLFEKSMERMHKCFQARLFDQRWFVTIRDGENDELDGLVPIQKPCSAARRQLLLSRAHLL
jgi:hypothetical protein